MNGRVFGNVPVDAILLHGGPGAKGELDSAARALADRFRISVAAPDQSERTVRGLIGELKAQIGEVSPAPALLVGHSSGAVLALLFAAEYAGLVRKLVLVGCPPLDSRFVPEIEKRREANLSRTEYARFRELPGLIARAEGAEKSAFFRELGALADKSDAYCVDPDALSEIRTDAEAFEQVWGEMAKLRETGSLCAALRRVRCPVTVISGDRDPHPIEGAAVPLKAEGVRCEVYSLKKCGHAPFAERFASEDFYRLLASEITGSL